MDLWTKVFFLVKVAKLQDNYESVMTELLQEPPSTVERKVHEVIVQNLNPLQKKAVGALEAIAETNGNFIE